MRLNYRLVLALGVAVAFAAISATPADAVLLYKSAIRNKTAPTGAEANSGWQYQGHWSNGFEGIPIAPHYFITASHVGGNPGAAIWFRGTNYTTTNQYDDPNTDLRIYKVSGTFPAYAQLYTKTDEVGKLATVFGRGTGRGTDVKVGTSLKGWQWAALDKVESWGDNNVAGLKDFGAGYGTFLDFKFDRTGTANEAALSNGDSGGGVFIKDGTTWKLAGVNYLVDGPFAKTAGGATFMASIFDKGGLYVSNSPVTDTAADVPGNWYATSISRRISWINSIIGVPPKSATFSTSSAIASDVSSVPEPLGGTIILLCGALMATRRSRRAVMH